MSYVTAGLVAFIALLGGFYGGYRYEAARVPATTSNTPTVTQGTAAGAGAGRTAGGFAGAGGAGGIFAGRGGVGTISNLTATGAVEVPHRSQTPSARSRAVHVRHLAGRRGRVARDRAHDRPVAAA